MILCFARPEYLSRVSPTWSLGDNAEEEVTIGLVGKYVELQDAYKSINESLFQAATYNDHKLKLVYIHSEKLNAGNVDELLSPLDGVIIAPGFGQRGIEGKFVALKWCREHDVPTFGICLGMQCMVIEFARDVLGLREANSTEMNPTTPDNVIDLMEDQKTVVDKGGTMRLGAYDCRLQPGSRAAKACGVWAKTLPPALSRSWSCPTTVGLSVRSITLNTLRRYSIPTLSSSTSLKLQSHINTKRNNG